MNVRIFTDGACSKNPGPGGYGCLILLNEEVKKKSGFEENTTNNRMELKAVIEGIKEVLNIIYQEELKIEKLEIVSDSAYVVNAINKNWLENWKKNNFKSVEKKDIKNVDLWKELNCLLSELSFICLPISFVKIKGHSGNHFNEIVDGLAKFEIIKNGGK